MARVNTRELVLSQLRGHIAMPRQETALEQAMILIERQLALKNAVRNPYKYRFARFLKDCVWTIDEAGGGEVRKFPWGKGEDGRSWTQIWLEMEDALLRSRLLMVEKSRRVLASWYVCAFDIWLAAGGQDPRWVNEKGQPVLMRSDRNRQIVVAARKAEGLAGSEWFIERRIKTILDQFEIHGRHLWPDFPEWKWTCGEVAFDTNSRITGVPQGSDQLRGAGITHAHLEEVAFWERAKASITGALPVIRGGGHVTLITTANVGSYAKEIRDGTLRGKVH